MLGNIKICHFPKCFDTFPPSVRQTIKCLTIPRLGILAMMSSILHILWPTQSDSSNCNLYSNSVKKVLSNIQIRALSGESTWRQLAKIGCCCILPLRFFEALPVIVWYPTTWRQGAGGVVNLCPSP